MSRKRSHSSSSSSSDSSSTSGSSSQSNESSKRRKVKEKSSTRERDCDSSSSESDHKKQKRKEHKKIKKEKKRMKKKLKKEKKKLKREEKKVRKAAKKAKKQTEKVKETISSLPVPPNEPILGPAPGPPIPELSERAKAMKPMTKEEWDKRQQVIRKVYDEETGRHRLIKGDGEILEEIVSRDRHKEINRQATKGDGAFFQSHLASKVSR